MYIRIQSTNQYEPILHTTEFNFSSFICNTVCKQVFTLEIGPSYDHRDSLSDVNTTLGLESDVRLLFRTANYVF